MTLQLDTAVSTLEQGAKARDSGPLVKARLKDVQSFLREDLERVEATLREAVEEGPEPAVSSARHLIVLGGKRVRPMTLLLSGRCFGPVTDARFSEMAAVVELAHSATLLHDDVVDEGMERRGAPTSRRLFGNGISVLSGDLLLVNALSRTEQVAPELLGDLIATLRRLVDGEIIQLRGRTELDVSEETYERVLSDKTASLFAFAARSGARLAGASPEQALAFSQFGEHLGFAFQLVDDVIDYEGEHTGKALFADLVEGKLTLPLVLALQKDPSLGDLVTRIHAGDESVVSEVSQRVVESGSCDVVRRRAREYTDKAVAALSGAPQGPARVLLEIVAREMTRRLA